MLQLFLLSVFSTFSQVFSAKFSTCTVLGCYEECSLTTSGCDTLPDIPNNLNGSSICYLTTKNGEKFTQSKFSFSSNPYTNSDILIEVNSQILYNNSNSIIKGFGGAFTDAMTYNLNNLSLDIQKQILFDYFSINGSGYTFGRIPMASCDFSLYSYSWSNIPNDFELNNFSLTQEWDIDGKIKYINLASPYVKDSCIYEQSTSEDCVLKLYGSPWTAPPWMKVFALNKTKDNI